MTALVLYPLLTTAIYYMGARALITRWLWSRYPARLDLFMSCSACVGFWAGLGAGLLGRRIGLDFMSLNAGAWYTPLLVAACSIVWTPIVAWLHISTLDQLGLPGDEDDPEEEDISAS